MLNVSNVGYDVPLITRTDTANEAYKDFKAKNPNGVCLYVSFHYNALNGVFDNKVGGISTFYYPGAKDSEKLDEYVQRELVKGTVMYNRGVRTADFHVLRETNMTAILIESGFMDKLSEAKLMLDKNYQNEVATETFCGALNYLKTEYGVIVQDKKKSYQEEIQEATKWAKEVKVSDCTRLKETCTREEQIVMLHRLYKLNGGL